MVKHIQLSLLALVLLTVSCNEKVSPELKNSGVTGGSANSGKVVPKEYYVKVTNTSSELLNYQLHRTGNKNFKTPCKVTNAGVQLSNDLYTREGTSGMEHDDKKYDITCFYDMEELALFSNGFQFEIEASPNTCEYIAYTPFTFYDRMPGDSTTSVTRVTCKDTSMAAARAHLGPGFADSNSVLVGCNQMLDTGLAATMGTDTVRASVSDGALCEYDYSSKDPSDPTIEKGKNCDIGKISITDIEVVTTLAPGTGTPVVSSTTKTSTKSCGGKIKSCLAGPGTELGGNKYTELVASKFNEKFSKEYKYGGMIDKDKSSSLYYANFRAPLSNKLLDFEDWIVDATQDVWTMDTDRKAFDPNVMEYYAANRFHESDKQLIETIIPSPPAATEWDNISVQNGYTSRPYAAEPYVGLENYKTSPFYTINCLDSAFDVKARIRIAVRDWDRAFTKDSNLEPITDFRGNHTDQLVSRQDNPANQEIPGDPGMYNNFNDRVDWDNWIPMVRTTGPFTTDLTEWRPINNDPNDLLGQDRQTDTTTYPRGFFSPKNFTNGFW